MTRPATLLLAAAALTAPLALSAQTLDLPPRKPGLWEMSTKNEKPKPATVAYKMCADPATDNDLMEYFLNLGACKGVTRRESGSFVIDAECAASGKTAKSRTVITGDLQSAYTARSEGTVDNGDGKPPQHTLSTTTATWKSADCPAMKPGDIAVLGGWLKLNIKQVKALTKLIR
jgi:hypothetical protein